MELKAVEDMTRDEIAAERARLLAVRAELNGDALRSAADVVEEKVTAAEEVNDEEVAPEWPHLSMQYSGMQLEVRKPDESALVALTMAGTPGLSPQTQMRIFTKFLVNHLSADSFVIVVESMTDPDSGVDMQSLITELTKLRG